MLLVVLFACSATQFINKTDKPWNDFDMQHYAIAKKRCGEIYKKSPCVKVFVKRTERDFSVICTKQKDKS